MDLKKDLPKLGKETGGKVYYEVDGESIYIGRRPDYAEFKTKPYQDEETCVSVLLGISKPNALLLSFVRRMDSLSIKDRANESGYGLYRQLEDLFRSIRKTIDIGIATGDIGKVAELEETEIQFMRKLHSPVDGPENHVEHWLNCKFSNNRTFTALGFWSWMQENGYPIPEELAIEKNGHGEMVWAGHSSKTKQTTTIPVSSKTKWHQIHFRIVNPTRIEITTPDGMEPYHPDDLGLTQRTRDLFERIAADGAEYIRGVDKKEISDLRILLRKAVPMLKDSDPIPFVRNKGWRAEFHITKA